MQWRCCSNLSATGRERVPRQTGGAGPMPRTIAEVSHGSLGFFRVRSICYSRRASRLAHRCSKTGLEVDLLYLSTQFLWWQAVVGIIGVTSSTALRSNSRCTWRHSEGSRNVHHTAIRRALSPSRPCGSVTAGVHGCPRGVAPMRPQHRDQGQPGGPHVRGNDPTAAQFLLMRGPPCCPLFASWQWPLDTGCLLEAIDMIVY